MPSASLEILNYIDKTPVPAASLQIVDANGRYLGQGVAAGNDGKLTIQSALIPGNYFLITSVGYESLIVETGFFGNGYKQVLLMPKGLDDIIVKAGDKSKNWKWWVIGLALTAYFVFKTRKRAKQRML